MSGSGWGDDIVERRMDRTKLKKVKKQRLAAVDRERRVRPVFGADSTDRTKQTTMDSFIFRVSMSLLLCAPLTTQISSFEFDPRSKQSDCLKGGQVVLFDKVIDISSLKLGMDCRVPLYVVVAEFCNLRLKTLARTSLRSVPMLSSALRSIVRRTA